MTEPPKAPVTDLTAVRAALQQGQSVSATLGQSGSKEGAQGSDGLRRDGLPEDCPIQALGVCGDTFYYLDTIGQLREIPAGKHGRAELQALFQARYDWCLSQWPRFGKDGGVTGVRWETATHVLMAACSQGGIWSSLQRVRGVGAWAGDSGELVLHHGDEVAIYGATGTRWERPSRIGAYVYPASPAQPRPVLQDVGVEQGQRLLTLLQLWPWGRPAIDPVLLLGWIGCAMLGAAIPWRPIAWVTSEGGGGKSFLKNHVLTPLFDRGCLSLEDATEAGIRTEIGHSCLPVILDEAEPDGPLTNRGQSIIGLARRSSSGGSAIRGSADHKAQSFTIRSSFLFMSVLVQGLLPQDASRICVLDMLPLPSGAVAPVVDPEDMARLGAAIRKRMVQAWPRLAQTRVRWAAELALALDARGQDVYAALLAAAEVLIADDVEDLDGIQRRWAEAVADGVKAVSDRVPDYVEFCTQLLSCTLDQRPSGERRPISDWIERAAGRIGFEDAEPSARLLATVGLAVRWHPLATGGDPVQMLCIANRSPGLAKLLEGTRWAMAGGASPPWVQAARRLARAHNGIVCTASTIWIGAAVRAAMVPIRAIINQDERSR